MLLALLLVGLPLISQEDSLQVTVETRNIPWMHAYPQLPSGGLAPGFQLPFDPKDEVVHRMDWECLGPNYTPLENNPGGKAIPTYSAGRGNGTGRINFLLVNPQDPSEVFACSPTGGLFHTTDEGRNWEVAGTDKLPVSGTSSITIDPNQDDRWIIATGDSDDRFMFSDGVWRTDDGGENWTNINGRKPNNRIPTTPNDDNWTLIRKVVMHPCDANRVFVASNKGLFVTNNAWEEVGHKVKWELISEGEFYDIEIVPWEENVVFAAGEKFFWSKNCGQDWQRLRMPEVEVAGQYKFHRLSLELCEDDPDEVYVAFTCSEKATQSGAGEAYFLKYHYRAKSWRQIRSLKQGMNNVIPTRARAFAVSPADSLLVLAANVQPVYRSTNGGLDFSKIERGQMHDDVHHLEFAPDGKTVWAAHDGGVSISRDGGLTFESRDFGIGAANIYGLSVAQTKEPRILYGAYDTGGNVFRDGSWYHVSWGDGFQTIIDHEDPDIMYVTKQSGYINRSRDGFDFDQSVSCGLNRTEWHTWIRQNTADSTIYCSGDKLGRSVDRGENWEIILDPKEYGDDFVNVYRFWLSETDPDVMYAYVLREQKHRPVLIRTFNLRAKYSSQIKWEVIKCPRDYWLGGLAIDADKPEKVWMAYKSYEAQAKLWRYTGTKWIDISLGLDFSVVESIVVDPENNERVYLGTNQGIYTRSRSEKKWSRVRGLPGCWIRTMDINRATGKLVVGTFGRGVWQADLITSN